MIIEESGITTSGHQYVVVVNTLGNRNGYVGVTESSPLFDKYYDDLYCMDGDIYIDVHGGLTYSGDLGIKILGAKDIHFFGFDCAHLGDGKIPEDEMHDLIDKYAPYSIEEKRDAKNKYSIIHAIHDMHSRNETCRSLEYVRNECFSLSKQLKEIEDGLQSSRV